MLINNVWIREEINEKRVERLMKVNERVKERWVRVMEVERDNTKWEKYHRWDRE